MTARRGRSRRTRGSGALAILVALPGLVLLARALELLVILAVIGSAVYLAVRYGRRQARPVSRGRTAAASRRTAPPHYQLGRVTAERDQLEAERDALRRQLDRQAADHEAECARLTDAIHAAWDAAANARPTSAPAAEPADDMPADVARMLADPLSGVRRLGAR